MPRSKFLWIKVVVLCGLLSIVLWKDSYQGQSSLNIPGWRLVFDDEFNGKSLDTSKWNTQDTLSDGYHNCCLDYGLQDFTPDMLSVEHGLLRITTQRQQVGTYNYTSGAITTESKFSFLYGRINIRARLPKTKGLWPAFWLLPDGSQGIAPYEIDMMELLGKDPKTIYMTNHWKKVKNEQIQQLYKGPDFSKSYHIFSIVWDQKTITWYIDGKQHFRTSNGVSNKHMYLIINTSVGGWAGNPEASTVFPQYLDIDYVRIYQKESALQQ